MKIQILFTSLILSIGTLLSAEDSNDILVFQSERDGTRITEYKIRWDSIRDLPEWNPEAGEAPLPLKKAIEVARAWVMKQNPDHPGLGLDSIHLGRIRHSGQGAERWYYHIKFHRVVKLPEPFPASVVVLMNGTIVEPTVRQIDSPPQK